MSQKKNSEPEKDEKNKPISLNISFSIIITFCVVLVSCICLAFVMGVIVGRGDNPQAHLPTFPSVVSNNSDDSNSENSSSVVKQEVMPKEELDYSNSLKDKNVNAVSKQKDQEKSLLETQEQTTLADKPKVDEKNNTNTQVTTEEVNTIKSKDEQNTQTALSVGESDAIKQADVKSEPKIFDFIFQVATFTAEEPVDRLRARLEGEGLRTKMEKSGKFYKVMVLMRGSNEQAQDLRKLMVSMKLGEPLQRGKKEIE